MQYRRRQLALQRLLSRLPHTQRTRAQSVLKRSRQSGESGAATAKAV